MPKYIGHLPLDFGKDKKLHFRFGGNKKYAEGWDRVFGKKNKETKDESGIDYCPSCRQYVRTRKVVKDYKEKIATEIVCSQCIATIKIVTKVKDLK